MKIVRRAAIALAVTIFVLGIAGVLVVQSAWFQDYIKHTIITSTEESTGGKAEIGSFHFDWRRLTAVATDFVIHGSEPPGAAPMLRAARVQLNLRLFTSIHRLWDIAYLGIERPQANVIIYPDGHTNIPSPRPQAASESPLETVADLAIGRFELNNGLVILAGQKQALDIRANNLRAQLSFIILSQEYRGQLSLQPVYVASGRNTPVDFTINVPLQISRDRIEVQGASIASSKSAVQFDASIDDLKNLKMSAHATGHIALADLKNAAGVSSPPGAANNASVVDLDANASVANHGIEFTRLRLALGNSSIDASGSLNNGLKFESRLVLGPGEIANVQGTAALDSKNNYRVHGNLKNLDLAASMAHLPYGGVLSGPIDVAGNLDPGIRGLRAQAKLSIAPGSHGIPVSGNLSADYSGAKDDVTIQKSVLTLPHSRLSLDGSVGSQLNVALTTTNLDDLFAALPQGANPRIALNGGQASFTGKITGGLRAPSVSGHLTATRFTIAGRQFDSIDADASLTKDAVAIENGSLSRNTMQARFSGSLGLRDWKPLPDASLMSTPVSGNASIQNGDLADLLALAGQPSSGYSGQVNANVSVYGTLGNPTGAGSLMVTNGVLHGQPFDRAEAHVNLTDQLVTVPSAFVQLGPARVNLTGDFRHPRDRFGTGQLRADLQSAGIDLARVSAVQKQRPNTAGVVQIRANITGNLSNELQLTSVNGTTSVRGLQSEGRNYGDLTVNASTIGQSVNYKVTSNFAGSNVNIEGSTQLARDYPTTAQASLGNLPVQRLLALANRTAIPVTGLLSGTAKFTGTIGNPQGSADLTLSNANIYDAPVDRVHFTARYDGQLQFHLDTNSVDLARVKTLAGKRPGLGGTLQVNALGAAEIRASDPRILLRDVSGSIKTAGLALNGKSLGDLTLTASTTSGRTSFTLHSSIAGATMEGRGSVQLAGDYPTDAQLTFKNATWAGLRPLLGYSAGEGSGLEAAGDGQISLNGPLLHTEQLRGLVQVTRLEVTGASSVFRKTNSMLLRNQGPIAAALDRETLQIQSAHLTGPQTDIQATGTVPLSGQDMSVAINGSVNLAILEQFNQSITSSGNVVLAAGLRGTPAQPRLTGQMELHNAAFDYVGMPAGVSKANGVIALNRDSAVIRNLSAEAGGGQVSVTGSATMNGELRFGLQAKATRVRIQVQQGLGVVASANVGLSGTAANSSLSGAVTVEQVSYAAKSDLGSLLSLAAPPVQTPYAPSPVLENMRLDVRVRSSSALGVQSSVAQNLQLTSDLRIRGSAAHPGVLGRVVITEGKLVFFGSTYTVNIGTIAFYNPIRIEPILDLSLETQAQGVDVVLKVTGPIDNMKLSYTSDPPLQFEEIVNLLATGNTPTSDPTLLANQASLPAQNFQQIGESAIVGRALADPVTSQLQRVFGITQLKINPAFTSGSQLPQAQLSLQQQISTNVTVTYITGLNTANADTIQVLWTISPRWSAQALRDYNGIFSLTLIYKKQIR
jgi:translocation and assembly module TamB